jgi:hypothetical protein
MSETVAACEPEWAVFAAIDWAGRKNFWRLVPAGSPRQEQGELENTPEAVEVWAAALQQRFAGQPIAVCLIVAFGTQRDRCQGAYQLQCHSGIAPVKEASGTTAWPPALGERRSQDFRIFRRKRLTD